jgi:hypothetical protein
MTKTRISKIMQFHMWLKTAALPRARFLLCSLIARLNLLLPLRLAYYYNSFSSPYNFVTLQRNLVSLFQVQFSALFPIHFLYGGNV